MKIELNLFAGMMLVFSVISCNISEPMNVQFEGMEPVNVFDLQVPEPSGLALNTANSVLYTVSDPGDNRVYKLALDGTVLATLSYEGDDLEGIAYDDRDQTLWLAEEGLRQIVHIDTLGNELSRKSIDYPGGGNTGFEGLCLLPDGRFFVLNEMEPGAILELDADLNLTHSTVLDFALDYSGICFVESTNEFFVVSDMSKKIFVLDENLQVIFDADFENAQVEGVEFNPLTHQLFIVNDASTHLSVFNFEY